MATLFAGTSGFAYHTWKPDFYPAKLPQAKFLQYYATQLNTVEVNFTFRQLIKETTAQKWIAETPPDFRFGVKAHQVITHITGLDAADRIPYVDIASRLAAFAVDRQGVADHGLHAEAVEHGAEDLVVLGKAVDVLAGVDRSLETRLASDDRDELDLRAREVDGGGHAEQARHLAGRLHGKVTDYPMNYSRYLDERETRIELARAAYENQNSDRQAANTLVTAGADWKALTPDDKLTYYVQARLNE